MLDKVAVELGFGKEILLIFMEIYYSLGISSSFYKIQSRCFY